MMGAYMGLPVEQEVFAKHPGKRYLPDRTLQVLPDHRRVVPGSLVTYFKALPPGQRFLESLPENLYWWADVSFMPHCDCSLVVSVGAYLDRPGASPLTAHSRTHGLIYTATLQDSVNYNVIKGTHTPGLPNVAIHPGGNVITYANSTNVVLMNLHTRWTTKRSNEIRINNFKNTTITADGNYVAVMSRSSQTIELETFLISTSFFVKQYRIDCHHVCPGFRTQSRNPANFECKFSPDNQFIACASSVGQLFVVQRYELKLRCVIFPGFISDPQVRLSNERCFDYDPRYLHRLLAFCDNHRKLYVCDVDNEIVVLETDLSDDQFPSFTRVDCVKYCCTGRTLAVAQSDATIRLLDPDTLDTLYTLDGAGLHGDGSMGRNSVLGDYPAVVRMAFSTSGDLLTTTATDGVVRVWQLWPDLSLQELCRRTILRAVKMKNIPKLPLPSKLVFFLLQWPQSE